jgi:hypothetical protein
MNRRPFIGSAGVIAPYQKQHMSASRVRPAAEVVSQAQKKFTLPLKAFLEGALRANDADAVDTD